MAVERETSSSVSGERNLKQFEEGENEVEKGEMTSSGNRDGRAREGFAV